MPEGADLEKWAAFKAEFAAGNAEWHPSERQGRTPPSQVEDWYDAFERWTPGRRWLRVSRSQVAQYVTAAAVEVVTPCRPAQ